jgi:PAS domain S-box-containing protein
MDVTRWEHVHRSLREVIEGDSKAVVILDRDARVLYANPAAETVFGRPPESMVGRPLAEASPEEANRALCARLHEAVASKTKWFDRIADPTEASPDRMLEVHFAPLNGAAAGPGLFAVTLRDVTAEANLRSEFQQAQRLEAVGRLAAGVAHDFANQLTVVHGYCDLLLRDLPDDDRNRKTAERVRQAGQRAIDVARRFLSWGRQHKPKPEDLDINAVVSDLGKTLSKIIGEDIRLRVDASADPPTVRADRALLEQAVLNLVINARDAMPGGGTLTLTTQHVDIAEPLDDGYGRLDPGAYVVLHVADTGTGMPAEVLNRVFDPFFTTKGDDKGTGLGLPMVFSFAEQSGGHIAVATNAGQGTRCDLYLPAARPTTPAAETNGAAPCVTANGGNETVLIAEDEPGLRNMFARELRNRGYHVLVAGSTAQAVALTARDNVRLDLLVADLVMPGAKGPALARRLRRIQPGLKVLFISGYPPSEMTDRGISTQDGAFLAKPFGLTGLLRKVREVLDADPPGVGSRTVGCGAAEQDRMPQPAIA